MKNTRNIPFISVCVPSYKNPAYLQRLLNSLKIQSLMDFEVIISDDSPDQSVQNLISFYAEELNIRYYKNVPSLGTPENWNEAIRQARGEWIKLIHDDDWLASKTSLQEYADAISQHPGVDFFFSAYYNVKVDNPIEAGVTTSGMPDQSGDNIADLVPGNLVVNKPRPFRLHELRNNPVTLLSKNVIGPPSVVIHRNDQKFFYDKNLKWLVDIDFYIRYLDNRVAEFIDKPLVNIGLSEQQVTRSSYLIREVEIPEHFRILTKTGVQNLSNILVYDAWWRLMRNLKIKEVKEIQMAGYDGTVPAALVNLINFQRKIPFSILNFGPASKSLMLVSYSYNRLTRSFHK